MKCNMGNDIDSLIYGDLVRVSSVDTGGNYAIFQCKEYSSMAFGHEGVTLGIYLGQEFQKYAGYYISLFIFKYGTAELDTNYFLLTKIS